MIFKSKKKYRLSYNNFIIHLFIFISISFNIFSSISAVDFFSLTCMIIYLSKRSQIEWNYPIFIFLWGIYCDLIIGYPIGYSSILFLSFLLLNQLSNYLGIFNINKIRFLIFFISLLLFLIIENFIIYLQFGTSISIFVQILKAMFVLLLYFPINFFISNKINLYD